MDVIMGLVAAVLWGSADFLIGINARAVGIRRAVFFGQLLGLLLMGLIVSISAGQLEKVLVAPASALLLGGAAALCTVLGALSLSKAFATGNTALVAPIVTSYGIFTTLLAWLGGDELSPWQFVGLLTCFLGVLLASSASKASEQGRFMSRLPIGFALLAAALYGFSFWLQGKFVLPSLGPVNMLALGYAVGVVFLIREALKLLRNWSKISAGTCASLCGASLCNLGGFSAFSWGALNGSISIVTVISTLSGGIAAILGFLFYRERLSCLQMVGVSMVLAGAVLLHLFG